MFALLFVSLLWAFSFGIIKGELTDLPPTLVAHLRLLISFIVFLPVALWLRKTSISFKLIGLGVIQFGVMYIAYIFSYQYLPGYLVAVLTIFTPLYVMIFDAMIKKRFNGQWFLPIILSILGAGILVYQENNAQQWLIGFLILQVANLAFAFGQIYYKHDDNGQASLALHSSNMANMYFGAALFSGIMMFWQTGESLTDIKITSRQFYFVLYLGAIASGLGFFLWNWGAKHVSAASLAIMNNGYVPLAIILSFTLFGERPDFAKLLLGTTLIVVSLLWAHKQQAK
ncbi:EamA family transporter [Thalassotalea eurytherma]|uniref:Membrane protein YigM n=1 Tax=Thalassotalea eurytherma TaxID=1144278 RepID=A0ABQ6H1F1_9GAMM|nr:EamA family transporter [Thalassotalea eurytherma]GLX80642.1 putative membrane protein YigM [Thalassotalea eurytherma]